MKRERNDWRKALACQIVTDDNDYPLPAPDLVLIRAAELRPNVGTFAIRLFDGPPPWAKLRRGRELLGLGEKYSDRRPDAAVLDILFELIRRLKLGKPVPTLPDRLAWAVVRSSTTPPFYASPNG